MLSVMRVSRNCGKFSIEWSEGGDGIVRIMVLELKDQDSPIPYLRAHGAEARHCHDRTGGRCAVSRQ